MNGRVILLAAAVAALAGDVPGADPKAASERASGGGYVKTGWMVHAGYFFHDTMFYGAGRGGLHAGIGRVFPLSRHFGLWSEAGGFFASGTLNTVGVDADSIQTRFASRACYLVAGPSFSSWPLPFGLALYFHRTALEDKALTGPLAGVSLDGRKSGFGLGLVVNILGILGRQAEREGRRVRATIGYAGFVDSTPCDIVTSSPAGDEVTHKKWKPFRGESLRAGVELDF